MPRPPRACICGAYASVCAAFTMITINEIRAKTNIMPQPIVMHPELSGSSSPASFRLHTSISFCASRYSGIRSNMASASA